MTPYSPTQARPLPLVTAAALLVSVTIPLTAQIELGEEWLLDVDFALTLGVDTLYAERANLGAGGGNQTWTFTGLTAHDTARLRTRPVSEGRLAEAFPTADFIFTADIAYGIVPANTEAYMRRQDDDVFIVGIDDPIGSPLIPQVTLDQPFAFQSAPIVYEQVGDASTRIVRTLDADTVALALDTELLTAFDSVRITVGQSVDYVVDAWGTVIVEGRSYETLRLRSVTVTELFIEALIPGQPYLDVTELVADAGLVDGVGTDTTVDYSWVAAEISFPVAQVTLDDDGNPDELRFALEGSPSSLADVRAGGLLDLRAAASGGSVAFDVSGAPLGARGTLAVYDAAGTEIARVANFALDASHLEISTAAWPAGVKLATVWAGGRPVATRRFVTR